jgi:hypothetical protein
MLAIMGRKAVDTCVFCGQQAELTREHVVARNLFQEPLPQTMVTVGVCRRCNNGKSSDDTYLRDYLLSDLASRRNPVAQALWSGKVMRSVKRNRSEIARTVARHARRKSLHSPGGIYLGSVFAAPVETVRLESTLGKMVRGLYFHASRTLLPQDILLEVSRIDRFQIRSVWDDMEARGAGTNVIHPHVFACRHYCDAQFPFYSRWLLLFYNTILIEVLTLPSNWQEHMTSEATADPTSGLMLPDSATGTGSNPP